MKRRLKKTLATLLLTVMVMDTALTSVMAEPLSGTQDGVLQASSEEASTEPAEAASTEAPTEGSTEPATAESVEASTVASTEPAAAASTESAAGASTESSTAASTESAAGASTESSAAASTESAAEASTVSSTAASLETSTGASTEAGMEASTEGSTGDTEEKSENGDSKDDEEEPGEEAGTGSVSEEEEPGEEDALTGRMMLRRNGPMRAPASDDGDWIPYTEEDTLDASTPSQSENSNVILQDADYDDGAVTVSYRAFVDGKFDADNNADALGTLTVNVYEDNEETTKNYQSGLPLGTPYGSVSVSDIPVDDESASKVVTPSSIPEDGFYLEAIFTIQDENGEEYSETITKNRYRREFLWMEDQTVSSLKTAGDISPDHVINLSPDEGEGSDDFAVISKDILVLDQAASGNAVITKGDDGTYKVTGLGDLSQYSDDITRLGGLAFPGKSFVYDENGQLALEGDQVRMQDSADGTQFPAILSFQPTYYRESNDSVDYKYGVSFVNNSDLSQGIKVQLGASNGYSYIYDKQTISFSKNLNSVPAVEGALAITGEWQYGFLGSPVLKYKDDIFLEYKDEISVKYKVNTTAYAGSEIKVLDDETFNEIGIPGNLHFHVDYSIKKQGEGTVEGQIGTHYSLFHNKSSHSINSWGNDHLTRFWPDSDQQLTVEPFLQVGRTHALGRLDISAFNLNVDDKNDFMSATAVTYRGAWDQDEQQDPTIVHSCNKGNKIGCAKGERTSQDTARARLTFRWYTSGDQYMPPTTY